MTVRMLMVMTMRRRRMGGLFKSTLFADFLGPSNGVVELGILARGVHGKTFDRTHPSMRRDSGICECCRHGGRGSRELLREAITGP